MVILIFSIGSGIGHAADVTPQKPTANFTTNVTDGIVPLSVQLNDTSSGELASWKWDFGDGTNSTEQNPMHTYFVAGNYTVNLAVSSANSTDSKSAIISAKIDVPKKLVPVLPVANFSSNVTTGGAHLSIQFNDNSDNVTGWSWNFGDGVTSTDRNPIHTYSAPGIYTVNLTVINENGTDSKLATIIILQPSIYAYITNMGSNTVSVIDIATNKVTATVNVGLDPLGVVVSPDSTKVYVANEGGTVSVIDTATNTVTATVNVGNCPYGIAVSPDGTKVFVTSQSKVSVIDTSTYNVVGTVSVGDFPIGVAVSPDGKKVYVTNYDYYSKNISVIDTTTYNVVGTVNIGDFPIGVAVSPDGKKIYVTSIRGNYLDGHIYVIDTSTNNVTATVNLSPSLTGVVVNPTGTKVYVANYSSYSNSEGTVSVIDTATNKVTATVNVGNCPYGVAVTPDGTKLYVANQGSNNVSVIDTSTNNVIDSVNVGSNPIAFGQFVAGKAVLPASNFNANVTQVITKITEDDKGKSINVKKGETFYLILSNFNYQWEISLSKGLILLNKGSIAYNLPSMIEAPDYVGGWADLWEIKAVSEGTQQIKGIGTLKRPWRDTETYSVNLIVDTPSPDETFGSSGRGGSGGGSAFSEPATNVEVKEISQVFITSGRLVKFDFPKNATSVVYVSFDSKKRAEKTTTIVEMLKGKSTFVSELPSDEVYKSLNIWVGNNGFATPSNIENAVVCFKVEKSWIRDKEIDESSITLNRYSDNKWNPLPTNLSAKDDKYLYFTAETPGFSPFAITGKAKATRTEILPATGNKTQSYVGDTQNKSNTGSPATNIEQTPEQKQSTKTAGKESTKTPDFEIASGIFCLLSLFLYKRR